MKRCPMSKVRRNLTPEDIAARVKMKQCECYAHGESECVCGAWAENTKEREKAIWNAAIDKAVEVAKKTFTACSKNPTSAPCNKIIAEELKKLKEDI